jgi:hypothetical protein
MEGRGFASKVLSFTPGFSPVFSKVSKLKTVSTVSVAEKRKPLKRLQELVAVPAPG